MESNIAINNQYCSQSFDLHVASCLLFFMKHLNMENELVGIQLNVIAILSIVLAGKIEK